uniref:Mur ligase domain-containing protein n=1 Tax=Brevundimonas sp. TaxID=1871086 RepID=UPI0028AB971A
MSQLRLSELLRRDVASDPEITAVTADSRKVVPGALFVALPGTQADGRAFIPQALAKGAAAVLAPSDTPEGAA